MIGWLQPLALWGLGLLALPVAIHLLQQRHAQRVLFPSTRFVHPSRTAAVRLRPPSDLILLAVRMSIVSLAVLAVAQPLWLSASRIDAWNARTARAIVVDTSASMRAARSDRTTPAADAEAAALTEASAAFTYRVGVDDLREGLRRAAAWLETAPPARREIVVISDFQNGAVTAESIRSIDPQIGIRFVRTNRSETAATVDGVPLLDAPGGSRGRQTTILSADGTAVRMDLRSREPIRGFRVLGSENEDEHRLLTALALAGTPAPHGDQPIAMVFAPMTAPDGVGTRFSRWMIETAAGIERDVELASLAQQIDAGALPAADGWTVLLRDRQSNALVRAAALDRELVLQVAAPASSYFSAAVARAALVSRFGPVQRPEHEILAVPEETLTAWTRAPGPVGETAWRNADASDARWLWAAALLLLVAEHLLRSRTIARKDETRAAA